jgi:AraC-like DNA-binding protein
MPANGSSSTRRQRLGGVMEAFTTTSAPYDLSVGEVAERVGYGSASTFSTAFSRHVGRPRVHRFPYSVKT